MSIASEGGSGIRSNESSIPFGPVAVVSVVFAGLYAAIRLRERRKEPRREVTEIPAAIREDIGLPPREKNARGWWEWR